MSETRRQLGDGRGGALGSRSQEGQDQHRGEAHEQSGERLPPAPAGVGQQALPGLVDAGACAGAPVAFWGPEAFVRGPAWGAAWDIANGGGTGSAGESRRSPSSRPSPERSCSSIVLLLLLAGSTVRLRSKRIKYGRPGSRGRRLTGRLPAHRALLYFIVVIGAGGACVDRCEFVLTLTADGRYLYALLSERMRTCVNSSHSLAKSASVATTTRTRTRRTTRTASSSRSTVAGAGRILCTRKRARRFSLCR